jgi:hypothetical protein
LICDESNRISFGDIHSLATFAVVQCVEKDPPHTALVYITKGSFEKLGFILKVSAMIWELLLIPIYSPETPWWITINARPVGFVGPHTIGDVLVTPVLSFHSGTLWRGAPEFHGGEAGSQRGEAEPQQVEAESSQKKPEFSKRGKQSPRNGKS